MNMITVLGCDIGQGFYMSKPIDTKAFEKWAKAINQQKISAHSPHAFFYNEDGNHPHYKNI